MNKKDLIYVAEQLHTYLSEAVDFDLSEEFYSEYENIDFDPGLNGNDSSPFKVTYGGFPWPIENYYALMIGETAIIEDFELSEDPFDGSHQLDSPNEVITEKIEKPQKTISKGEIRYIIDRNLDFLKNKGIKVDQLEEDEPLILMGREEIEEKLKEVVEEGYQSFVAEN